jgi:hypothetical protein
VYQSFYARSYLAQKNPSVMLYLLPKLGNSNLQEQTFVYNKYYHYLKNIKEYKVIVLGNRKFCSVDLASWRCGKACIFLFEDEKKLLSGNRKVNLAILRSIRNSSGYFFIFSRVRVRKTRPVVGCDIAWKSKRNLQELKVKAAWFILTNLGSLRVAIAAYKKRIGIE